MNQAWGAWPGPRWAVPVLPPTLMPSILAPVPVPFSTTLTIMSWSLPATSGVIGSLTCSGLNVLIWEPSTAVMLSTTLGAMRLPSLAMVAAMTAISSGDARTSRWPIALWATAGESSLSAAGICGVAAGSW